MQQLIQITEREGTQVVSAKELYTLLDSHKGFSPWINKHLQGLDEGVDYIGLEPKGIKPKGGRPEKEKAYTETI
jgi:phage anti-repressor protein